jgi:hypothetical protein
MNLIAALTRQLDPITIPVTSPSHMPIYKILIHNKTNDPRNGVPVKDPSFIEGQLSQQLALDLLSDHET